MPSSKKDINQQLRDTIYKKVTKKTHNHGSPKKNGDGTIKKCIELFKEGASPEVLTKLEKSLREQLEKSPEKQEEYQKHYKYYIENFLPALKDEVIKSEELAVPTVFNNEREQSQRPQTIRGKIVETILDITNRSSDKDSKIEEQPINSIKEEIPVSSTGMTENNVESLMTQDQTQQKLESLTKEEVCASDSDSGINSPGLASSSRRSSLTLVTSTSSEESLNSIPSVAEENNDPQTEDEEKTELLESNLESPKENKDQVQPEQAAPEEPQVQESGNSGGQEGKISSQVEVKLKSNGEESESTLLEEELKLEEKKKEAVLSEQSAPDNNNNDKEVLSKKQPNNRNLHVALVAGCALLAVGCLVAAAIARSGILCVIGAVFAIAAITTWYLTPSSELTSTNLSRPVDDKELTACSHL